VAEDAGDAGPNSAANKGASEAGVAGAAGAAAAAAAGIGAGELIGTNEGQTEARDFGARDVLCTYRIFKSRWSESAVPVK
jgi:hypothetical protein